MANNFAPLRIVSGYSFLKSGLTMDRISASIKKNDYYGAGLSDFGVLYGVPSFVDSIKKLGKKSLIGLSVSLEDEIVLYALNEDGYHSLIQISKLISEEKLTLEELKANLTGLAVVIETNYGKFKEGFDQGFDQKYLHYLAELSKGISHFYLGIEVTSKEEFGYAQKVREFAKNHSYSTIAFPRIRYQNSDNAIILTIVNAIEHDEKITVKEEKGQSYFMKFEDYQKLYTPRELSNTVTLVDASSFNYEQKRGKMLSYPVSNSEEELRNKSLQGLRDKNIDDEKHIQRLNYELDIIVSMGYADYFLIVSDFISYAKHNDILVGPGRGSAAGSLVSYCLDITEVDPLDYDLQFERFLNKARKTMPDIDVDFMDTRREDVVDYVRNKYGENKVATIATFQTIQAKQALRDIGRIYEIPTRHIDLLSKSITDKMSLRDAYKKLETFRKLVDSDKYFLEIVSLASKIEGLPRQAGMHAAGVVLNDSPLEESLPITVDLNNHYTTQYEKDYLEDQGFLKMDFLSLRTLTTIDLCIKMVNAKYKQNLNFYSIPYKDDANIFKIIASGMTAGIFQLESSGMKNATKILEPKTFEDIVVLLAIFRPGAMDSIKDYHDRAIGKKKVTYLSKEVENILKSTFGVLIYQEQISKLATVMAGYSPEEADLFRRAVSHKEKTVLESSQKGFVSGSIKNGYSEKDAKKMFADILKFADYGFNKSHAVVYAITACRMAYLKYYYPLEFYVALLMTSAGVNDSKFSEYVSELRIRGLKIFAPDINESGLTFKAKEGGLLLPINAIKGLFEQNAHKIVDERTLRGPYKDFYDFVTRMSPYNIGESTYNKLIDAGCFDNLYPSRETLRNTLLSAIQFAELSYGSDGQMILDETLEGNKKYYEAKDDPLDNLNKEYELLGIMLSDNPLRYKKDLLHKHHVVNLVEAKERNDVINIAGIVSSTKTIKTRKSGDTMAFIKLFDEYGEIEITVFPKLYVNSYRDLVKNKILLIKGRYDKKDEKESFIAEAISLLEEVE